MWKSPPAWKESKGEWIFTKIFSLLLILEILTSGPVAMYLIPEKMNAITFSYQQDLPKKPKTTHTEMCLLYTP